MIIVEEPQNEVIISDVSEILMKLGGSRGVRKGLNFSLSFYDVNNNG